MVSYGLFGEFDAESEPDRASPDPLAVGPLAGDAGRVLVEVRPVVVGRLGVLGCNSIVKKLCLEIWLQKWLEIQF